MRKLSTLFGTWVVLAVSAATLGAQVVRGTVVLPDSAPLPGAIIVAKDSGGRTAGQALTNQRGEFSLRLAAAAHVSLTVLRIGYRPTIGPSLEVRPDRIDTVRIVFDADAVSLAAVNVRPDRQTCRVAADTGLMVARVWAEARKAMLSTQLVAGNTPLIGEWIEYDRLLDSTARRVREQRVRISRNPTAHAFRSQPAVVLAEKGYVVNQGGVITFYAPDAEALLSDVFAAGHCFHLENAPRERANLIGVGFTPSRDRRELSEIEGTFWLDRSSAELRSLEFRYTNLSELAADAGAGGEVEFLRLSDGNWLVSRWNVRMPQLVSRPRTFENAQQRTAMGNSGATLRGVQVTGGEVRRLMRADSVLYRANGPEIVLQVLERDTLVRAAQAVLTIDGTEYSAKASSTGRIELSSLLPGRYHARVSTPLMDSLEMTATELDIEARKESRVDTLTLPGARVVVQLLVLDVTGAPLPETTLEAQPSAGGGARKSVVTERNGRALLRDFPPGPLTLKTKRLGYQPGELTVAVQPGRNEVPIILSQVAPPVLEAVRVEGAPSAVPRLEGFETRRANKQTTASITHEDILKRNPAHTWQLLMALPSVRIVDHDTLVFAQSTRSTLTSPEDACYMQIAVDGVVLSNVPGKRTYDLRQLPPPDQIHGIEVFAGPATISVPLGGAGDRKWCGLIAVWTR